MKMKSSAILREAAWLVERGHEDCGCTAIGRYDRWARRPSEPDVFNIDCNSRPAQVIWELYWRERTDSDWDRHAPSVFFWGDDRDARVIGLCLAAAICESDGD